MESKLNIATWNLCLGLANKKEIVTDYLTANSIHACCLQETEIPMGFPEKTLNSGNYNIELEMNTEKKRAGIYVNNKLTYTRRFDLEKEDNHIVIIDIKCTITLRIICLYSSIPMIPVT